MKKYGKTDDSYTGFMLTSLSIYPIINWEDNFFRHKKSQHIVSDKLTVKWRQKDEFGEVEIEEITTNSDVSEIYQEILGLSEEPFY